MFSLTLPSRKILEITRKTEAIFQLSATHRLDPAFCQFCPGASEFAVEKTAGKGE